MLTHIFEKLKGLYGLLYIPKTKGSKTSLRFLFNLRQWISECRCKGPPNTDGTYSGLTVIGVGIEENLDEIVITFLLCF